MSRTRESLRGALRGAGWLLTVLLAILLLLYALSNIFSIRTNEVGVLLRFGKAVGLKPPGMHWALPRPVDSVEKVPIKEVKDLVIDDFSRDSRTASLLLSVSGLPAYCVSGDNNIITLSLAFKYKIADAKAYLFNVRQNETLLQELACNTVIHILAGMPVDEILTGGKQRIANEIQKRLTEKLEALGSGLTVTFVELRSVHPPEKVQQYFDDVINAEQDRRRMVNQAESYRNEQIPNAKAEASRTTQEALAYKTERVSKAVGETRRFLSQLKEMKGAEELSKRRIYLEFVRSIYPQVKDRILLQGAGEGAPAHLKILPGD